MDNQLAELKPEHRTVNPPLSSLEKFGALARKFLHDTSNDFTAIALNLHFLEKLIEPDNPAYKDFQNLAVALKSLQQNTRGLLNWRRQLPDPLQPIPAGKLTTILPQHAGWTVESVIDSNSTLSVRVCPPWLGSLVAFLAPGSGGTIRCLIIRSPNDQCVSAEQINLIFDPSEPVNYLQLPEIEWSLHRELAKLMGGGIALDSATRPGQATLFLPLY